MACVGTGKIKDAVGLGDAIAMVLSKSNVPEGVLRIISQEASGRIGVRGGRFIVGAHISTSGLTGFPALKTFLTLKRGMFYYLEGEEAAGGMTDLEQSLGVDLQQLGLPNGEPLLQRFSS